MASNYPPPAPYSVSRNTVAYGVTDGMGSPMSNVVANEMPYSSETPTAPPLDQLRAPQGYEGTTFSPMPLLPPQCVEAHDVHGPPGHRDIPRTSQITEEQVKSALVEFVGGNCCYGGQPIRSMVIRDVIMNSSFHYVLETFTERRETVWAFEPFNGQPVDGPQNGRSPGVWEVYAVPDTAFQKGKRKFEIPHSANVRICHQCTGNGRIRCKTCTGFGGSNCSWCNGTGRSHNEHHHHDSHHHHDGHHYNGSDRCLHCNGSGRSRCYQCHGHGQVKCQTCKGAGQLKCYLELTVTWSTYSEDYVCDDTGLSEGLIKEVTGNIAVDERAPRVNPLTNFPDRRIADASRGLTQKHATCFPMERLLEQRHHVRLVPVALVSYQHKNTEGTFYVYGLEQKVYFPKYPAKCCCGYCTIL